MKSFVLVLALVFTGIAFGQTLSEDIKKAIKSDDVKSFEGLVKKENLNTCFEAGNSNYTLMALTIKLNANSCFKLLLDRDVDLEKACSTKTPLMYAVKYGNLEMTKALIEAKANLDTKNNSGRKAVDYAKKYKQKEIYEYLKSL